MATLTRNTAGSLRKMCEQRPSSGALTRITLMRYTGPPVKKKAVEQYASFGNFLGQASVAATAPAGGEPKPAAAAKVVKKRKATDEILEDAEDGAKDLAPPSAADNSEGDKSDSKKKAPASKKEKKVPTEKKVPAVKGKGRPKKAAKKEESASEEEVQDKAAEDSADGGDSLGEFSFREYVDVWLNNTDCELGGETEDNI
jgi:hypothetical protein